MRGVPGRRHVDDDARGCPKRRQHRVLHASGLSRPKGGILGPKGHQNMGPGVSHPRNGLVPAGAPQQYDPLLAVRADGGVV